ncbi:MAG: hypothetical protein IT429_11185 [Gemmataceae bacterium]|nr:hypothetical protein [Gemmataceae bacterium]
MNTHHESFCPSCKHPIRIRSEYLGKRIACKHCKHVFLAVAPAAGGQPALPGAAAAPQATAAVEAAARERDLTAARTDADQLRRRMAELQPLEGRVAEMEGRLRDAGAVAVRLRKERGAAQASCRELTERLAAAETRVQDLAAAQAECARLAATLAAAQVEHEQARAEGIRLADELAVARTERDALAGAHAEAVHQTDLLQARFRELEQAQAEGVTTHAELARTLEEACAGWEAERRELAEEWERKERVQAEEAETRLRTEQERDRLQKELEALARQLADDRANRERWTQDAVTEAGALRQELQEALRQVEALRQERDRLDADRQELLAATREVKQRFQVEEDRLREDLEKSRQEGADAACCRDELAGQVRELEAELASVRTELQEARADLAARAADQTGVTDQLQHARDEVVRLTGQVEAFQRAAEDTAARHREETAVRAAELAAARADAERLGVQVGQLQGQTGRAAELEALLLDARAMADRMREQWTTSLAACRELNDRLILAEGRARDLAAAQAEGDQVRAECARLTDELAAMRAERTTLDEQVQRLQAELAQQRGQDEEARRQKALEAVWASTVTAPARRFGPEAIPPGLPVTAPSRGQDQDASRQDFAQERAALQDQLRQLQRENSQMRQWLANFGIHMG